MDRYAPVVDCAMVVTTVSNGGIPLKKSENERSRKSRFLAPNLTRAAHRHEKASARAIRDKTGHSAEALAKFSSGPPAAF
jgi:hypothetical protein